MTLKISPFERPRTDFPKILNERGLTSMGVEVGVAAGEFSELILKNWPGALYLVDPWEVGDEYQEQYDHKHNFAEVLRRTEPFKDRVYLVTKTSLDAVGHFMHEMLDWVYLDGDHRYTAVLEDLNAWYPKIRKGGIFAGDDYGPRPEQPVDFGHGQTVFGVKRAVDEFVLQRGKNLSLEFHANWEVNGWPARNWYFIV